MITNRIFKAIIFIGLILLLVYTVYNTFERYGEIKEEQFIEETKEKLRAIDLLIEKDNFEQAQTKINIFKRTVSDSIFLIQADILQDVLNKKQEVKI